MKAVIFSRKPPGRGKARSANALRGMDVQPLGELKQMLSSLPSETLVYLDVSGLTPSERSRLISSTVKRAGRRVGVLDPEGKVKDVAALFHAGIVDYVGKPTGVSSLGPKRFSVVRDFALRDGGERDGAPVAPAARVGGKSAQPRADALAGGAADAWEGISDGREHRFAFLYVEVDHVEDMRRRFETVNLASALETFRSFVERMVSAHGGRLWMWSRFGGLVLFPLSGAESPAPICGLRILLSRVFYDAEESPLPGRTSFRLALSVGSTVYNAGDSGKIVSDGVNSIFHLGRRFVRPGQFVLTAEAAGLTPEPLRPYMVPTGSFEGRRILRMLLPIPSTGVRA